MEAQINAFMDDAAQAEIAARQYSDPGLAEPYYAGEELRRLQMEIGQANDLGRVVVAVLERGLVRGVRRLSPNIIEVDTCESWSYDVLDRETGQLISSSPTTLNPQTVTVQAWRITGVVFHNPPAFC